MKDKIQINHNSETRKNPKKKGNETKMMADEGVITRRAIGT